MTRVYFLPIFLISLLSACSSDTSIVRDSAPSIHPANIELTPDAIPRIEAKSRGGNPASYKVFGKTYHVLPSSEGFVQRGIASWYGTKFHGNKTSNGETYDMYAMTAAHKTLPLPSYVEVRNLDTNKKIIVRVNDRGPFHEGRIIDLSYAAAAKLGTLKNGTSSVEIKVINPSADATPDLAPPPPIKQSELPPSPSIQQPFASNPTQGLLFIQVGAFSSLDNANRLKYELTNQLKTPVTVEKKPHSTDPLYLVQVGPYIRMQNADSTRLQLYKLGYKNTLYTGR
jgi:rare lipoprotein A